MSLLEPLRRGASEWMESVGEGWERLRQRSASALTRFRRRHDEDTPDASSDPEVWGVLAAELSRTEDEVVLRLEAPGMDEKDFSVHVIRDQLVVRGEKRFQREDRAAHYHLVESAYGAFERRFALPCPVDPGRAQARYARGVLTVRLPRSERSARRRIEVARA